MPSAVESAFAADPVLDPPTLHCLGAYWVVPDGGNAGVAVAYRKSGQADWHAGAPLFRVEPGKHIAAKYGSRIDVPDGAALFAGSVVDLEPGTPYDLRLSLNRGNQTLTRTMQTRTRAEPQVPANAPIRHVIPDPTGTGGGSGTAADPFRGLAAAQKAAKPGDVLFLHPGTYTGEIPVTRCGDQGRPIVWRGESADKVILDGKGHPGEDGGRVISASDTHDLTFENLTITNAQYGIVAHDASRITIRRCRITRVDYGVAATRNAKDHCRDFLIADNVIEGPSTWPRTKGIENARGVQLTGAGHVVCYNRIRGFADAIDTFTSSRCEAIDFHNNEISEMTDDGVELDYSQHNVRCFDNRFTNVFQGISVQPILGGPVYVFRNSLCNVAMEPFKIHNSPSGALFYHNTVVKRGQPLLLFTREPASNIISRNNLFVGTAGDYAMQFEPKMNHCDFDYDGFGSGDYRQFLKWNGQRYPTFDLMRSKAPIERHATLVDAATAFASGARPPADEKQQQQSADLRLAEKSAAIDAGQPLPGFNDAFTGRAPDLGAYEVGRLLPHYGPRQD
ncbi:MAG TPA: right-handed parallel beta-helix repeat-containing protein [Tepidisphaeraceae bacterium]